MFHTALWSFLGFSPGGVQWQRVRPPSVSPWALSVAGVHSCASSSRLVPCVWLSTDVFSAQWWCKLLCGLWFLFNPALASAGGCQPSAGLVPMAGVPLSLPGHWFSHPVVVPGCWALPSFSTILEPSAAPCQPAAQLQFVLVGDALLSLSTSSNRFIWMGWAGVLINKFLCLGLQLSPSHFDSSRSL